ncbi:AEC family transporter [Alphaproteobacteria bacterium]|nr:AEC family transporter [Alphaproteobacteria bacterium]
MIDVLNISIPFFALIFLGFGAHAIGFIDAAGARTMSRFAFYVTLPPYMFLKVSASEPSSILNWGFVWRYESGTIIMYLTAAAIGYWLFRLKRLESGIFGLNVAYPNYGYMGIPLAILAFGDAAALPMALILFADTIVLLALTSCFVAGNDGGVTESVKRIAVTMVSNPLVLAVMAGLLFSASGLALPKIPQQFGSLLAGAAAPVALFALGATLFGQPVRAAAGEVTAISLLKLIVHPLLVAFFFFAIPGQDPLWIKVAILSSCLPVAANVFMLANHYGAYTGRTASAILVSTVFASTTVPVFLYWLFYGQG